jgi:hypothetical protein
MPATSAGMTPERVQFDYFKTRSNRIVARRIDSNTWLCDRDWLMRRKAICYPTVIRVTIRSESTMMPIAAIQEPATRAAIREMLPRR